MTGGLTFEGRQELRHQADLRARAALQVSPDGLTHGTSSAYKRGCRCQDCKDHIAAVKRAQRAKPRVLTHSYTGYGAGCRCDVCRAGHAERQRMYRRQASA